MRCALVARFLGLGTLLSVSCHAYASVDPVVQAAALVQAGHPQQAYDILEPLTAARAGDADFDYILGIAALDAGKPADAIIALQRALAIRPGFSQARAEIARAYALVGDVDTARREFKTVSGDPTVPDPVRRRFDSLVNGFDKIDKPGFSYSGYAQAGAGFDSNVNAATNDQQIVIPLFAALGPATLSGAAQHQSDGFGLAEGGLGLSYGFDRQSRVFASFVGSEHANFEQSSFDQTFGAATVGYAYTLPSRDVVSLAGQAQDFLIGGSQYRQAEGGLAQYTHVLTGDRAISFGVQYFDLRYRTDSLRNAGRSSVSLTYSDKEIFVGAQGGREITRSSAADYLSNDFYGLRAGIEHPLCRDLTGFGTVAIEKRDYGNTDPLFLTDREDWETDLVTGLRYRLFRQTSLVPQITYTHTESNIALYQYDRVTTSLALRVDF